MNTEPARLPPVQERLRSLPAYVTGRSAVDRCAERGVTDIVELAANENPLGPPPASPRPPRAALGGVHRYPDGANRALRSMLAEQLRVPPEMLLVTNGSEDALRLLAAVFLSAGDEAVMPAPSFPVYRSSTVLAGATPVEAPMTSWQYDPEALTARVGRRTRMVYLANPNNPTGTYLSRQDLGHVLDALPAGVLTVVDEAYREYADATDMPDGLEELRAGRPVAVLRTFSKAYGLAGLRIGYLIADPVVVDAAARVRGVFAVNHVAEVAACAALGDVAHLERTREVTLGQRRWLESAMDVRGLPHPPSQGNFLWVDVQRDADQVADGLLDHGVVVRSGALWGAGQHLRVTIGTAEHNRRFCDALDAVRR